VAARFVHWVAFDEAPPGAAGQAGRAAHLRRAYTGPIEGDCVLVMPRLGTVSPWASKATDIARNCGLVCTVPSASPSTA
jgi:phosphoribosylformylglycinamidine synthase